MLFMKYILSLSLAAFALATPVAKPQAVGELSGVGLVGRDGGVTNGLITGIGGIVNNVLNDVIVASVVGQSIVDGFLTDVRGVVGGVVDAAGGGESGGLDLSVIDGLLQEIQGLLDGLLGSLVTAGLIGESVVQGLLEGLLGQIGGLLDGAAGGSGNSEWHRTNAVENM